MKRVMTITGIRPDFIRMSHVFKRLDEDPEIEHTLVHTGQHYDKMLSDVFFDELNIRKPDYNLGIGASGRPHYEQLGILSTKIMELLATVPRPDLIMFLGDSNSVGVAFPLKKEGYKIAHIEAGMRSHDKRMLEEINRTVCDHCTDLHFVYHNDYKQHLLNEGLPADNIFVVGNTIVEPTRQIMLNMAYVPPKRDFILMDIHRPENFKYKDRTQFIMDYAHMCNVKYKLPVKMLNFKRTMDHIINHRIVLPDGVEIVDLMSFKEYVKAQIHAKFIISDSGTAQEEPALLGTKVIVPRDYTERPQSVQAGNSFMLDVNSYDNRTWSDSFEFIESNHDMDLTWLGNGKTSELIVQIIKGA